MTEFSVRAYREADESAVSSLWEMAFPDDAPRNAPDRIIRQKLTTQRELFLVGVLDERVVATVLGGYDGHRGWIYHLVVHPEHRRTGFGRELMQTAERHLRALACPKINLQVRTDNGAVVAFYESLGYTIEERLSLGKVIE
jgi:ribosomal protein S18 acetylase RimI-like enzyme